MRWGTKRVPALGVLFLTSVILASLAVPALAAGKTVHITKSESDGDAVAGATFTLYVDAPPVGNGPPKGAEDMAVAGTCTTAANGQCDITNVPPGDYWVSETGPPAGYTPAADSTLKVKKKNREVLVVNDRTPTNVSVNDPSTDAAVDDGTHIFQFGSSVAASPDGQQVFIAFNDSTGFYTPGGISGVGAAFSDDGGRTFVDLGKMPPSSGNVILAEPTVVFDPVWDRRVVAAGSFTLDGGVYEEPIVAAGWDPVEGWSAPVNTFPNIPSGASAHGPRLLFGAHKLFLTFTVSHGNGQSEGMVTTSPDGGATWTPPVSVTGLGTFDLISPAVGPNGRAYVTWGDYGGAISPTNDFWMSSSNDGGAGWSTPTPVALNVPKSGTETTCGTSTVRTYLGQIRTADAPRIAVSPFHPNRIFVTFPGQGGPGDESDVFLSTSVDGGQTWSTEPLAGPPGAVEAIPDIQVTPGGSVDVGLYRLLQEGMRLSLQLSRMDAFGGADTTGSMRTTIEVAPPSPIWNMADPFDTAYSPCFGLQGLQMDAPGSGVFLAWADGRDPGPVGNNGVDPNIFFARIEGPSLVTATTVSVSTTASKVKASGAVTPSPIPGARVTVTLYRDTGSGFQKVRRASVETGTGGRFAASFARPDGGSCKVTAVFAGSDERMPSSKSKTFAC